MRKFMQVFLYLALGVVGGIVTEYALYGKEIFLTGMTTHYYVSLGILGALTLTLVRFGKVRVSALLVLLFVILTSGFLFVFNLTFLEVLFYLLWYLGAGFTIFGAGCLFRTKIKRFPIGKFLILAVALAFLYVVKTFVIYIPFTKLIPATEIMSNARFGFLLGCGLGLGVEVGDLLGRLFADTKETPQESH